MDDYADALPAALNAAMDDIEREFERFLTESSTLAFRVAYSVLRQREDAEDVAQEAFAKAYRNFRQLRDRTRFRAWLARMTWRLAIDRYRATNRRKALELNAESCEAGPSSAEAIAVRERAERLWQAIDMLPEKFRMVIVLASIEGHEVAEVASLLGIPKGTVKSRLFAARQRLKEQL